MLTLLLARHGRQANLTVLRWPTGAPPEQARILAVNDTSHARAPGVPPWEPLPGA